jgi:hypothetical protein
MLQQFHKDGGDINAPNSYATPQPGLFHFSSNRKCSDHCPRALPVLAENNCFGLTPYPRNTFPWGLPHLATPPLLLLFPSLHAVPAHVPRALVHAAAAWHRSEWTPLMLVADNGRANAIALLAQLGVDVNAQSTYG